MAHAHCTGERCAVQNRPPKDRHGQERVCERYTVRPMVRGVRGCLPVLHFSNRRRLGTAETSMPDFQGKAAIMTGTATGPAKRSPTSWSRQVRNACLRISLRKRRKPLQAKSASSGRGLSASTWRSPPRSNRASPSLSTASTGWHPPKDMFAHHPLGRLGHPKEMAALDFFLLSDRAFFMTSGYYPVGGGHLAQ